jgi:hypothetical protein
VVHSINEISDTRLASEQPPYEPLILPHLAPGVY